ncbi:hypothetical protein OGAPHI_005213 [Ogataea philodendri]|uniref:Uncharacterized protein n=1 Tax=Ogataea philodendri TaxID=1378263 RepID=A0A9P8P1Y9_9ASCO|nr:uncharacterized protein OGAPHI_005213 [Ogataea philodendri]KAH3663810.1 hypothetical protein OGAPHI_005213 [Ogataea philodendri]
MRSQIKLARPVQESGHVLSHLGSGSWSAILVLNKVVKQNSTHRNGTTWEVWVVVGSWRQLDTCWWLVWVTGQQGEDVVTSTVSGLDNQREVRRQGTLVGSSGSLFVGVWAWDVVSKLTRSLLRVTLVIRLIVILKLLAHGSNLVLSVRHSHKSSPSDSVKGVAGSANLSVNLETSSDRGMVKSLEHAVVGPSVFRSVQSVLGSSHGLGSLRVLVKNVSGTKTNSSNNTLHSFLGVWRNTGCSGGEGSQSQWTPQ